MEEFTALMMGALSGRDPKEMLLAVFIVLSRLGAGNGDDNLITLDKLQAACAKFQVCTIFW